MYVNVQFGNFPSTFSTPKIRIYKAILVFLRVEYKMQVSGNKLGKIIGPTRDEVMEQFRISHNQDLYRPASIVGAGVAQCKD
jgi:hypothetical protein